ncbi:MAG TPA: hypothetical protein VEB64_04420 [Azospirillaceae bacterium]|nr:hypothetical protein [Azospirillaceae bacterium]
METPLFSPPAFDQLHAAYDGPLPLGVERVARLGGRARCRQLAVQAAERLHERLAADTRLGLARRRRHLAADLAPADPWLARLSATLAFHRRGALGARV